MVAARMKPLYEKEAADRKRATQLAGKDKEGNPIVSATLHGLEPKSITKGETNEIVGEMMKVSKGSVQRASKVIKDGTEELQQAVDKGEVSVRKAAQIATLPKEEQPTALKEALTPKPKPEPKKSVKLLNEQYLKQNADISNIYFCFGDSFKKVGDILINLFGAV